MNGHSTSGHTWPQRMTIPALVNLPVKRNLSIFACIFLPGRKARGHMGLSVSVQTQRKQRLYLEAARIGLNWSPKDTRMVETRLAWGL